MSLTPFSYQHPIFTGGDWFDDPTPNRLFSQHFGVGRDPFDMAMGTGRGMVEPFGRFPYWMRPRHVPFYGAEERGVSEVTNTKDKFAVKLDVSHFKPEEVEVKTVGDMVKIEGQHEEKMDEHGFIKRHFVRKYQLPKGVDPQTVVCHLSANGLLTVEAPKKAIEGPNERNVPVQPAIEQKKK